MCVSHVCEGMCSHCTSVGIRTHVCEWTAADTVFLGHFPHSVLRHGPLSAAPRVYQYGESG